MKTGIFHKKIVLQSDALLTCCSLKCQHYLHTLWKQILHPNVSRCDLLNTRYLCTCSLLVNLSIFVIDSIGPFFFHLCDDEPRLLMNKDTFIIGPSNQSLRLARQD